MSKLTCPVCAESLADTGAALRCGNGHSFDRAREGYVNLLAAGHGKTRLAGDTPEMLRARHRIFRRGYYERLSVEINLRASGRQAVLDAGCGVGYYIGQLAAARPESACFAFDISKHALKIAAKAYPEVTFFANDVKQRICMADASVDLLLNVFAPRNADEFARVLRSNGELLVVIPGAHHLIELRERFQLLRIDLDKPERTSEQLAPAFVLGAAQPVEYQVELPGKDIIDLIRMTPNFWHADLAALELEELTGQSVTMNFIVMQYSRA